MSFHIRDEMLSAYLDGEIEPARERTIDNHLTSCAECRARLTALRGVVLELRRAPRLQPPPVLAHQVRQQVVEQTPAGVWESLRVFLVGLPLHPSMGTVMAMGLALALSLSLVGPPQRVEAKEPVPDVQVIEGKTIYKRTTSRVGDVEFIFHETGVSENGVWVQEGLEGSEPETRVDSRSPEGRAVLTDRTDLDLLLQGGYSVVLSSEDGRTVELAPPLRGASLAWASARA